MRASKSLQTAADHREILLYEGPQFGDRRARLNKGDFWIFEFLINRAQSFPRESRMTACNRQRRQVENESGPVRRGIVFKELFGTLSKSEGPFPDFLA